MARIALFLRRHAARVLGLSVFILVWHIVAAKILPDSTPLAAVFEERLFAGLFAGLMDFPAPFTWLPAWRIGAVLIVLLAVKGLYLGLFRLTQNRLIGLGAGAFLGVNPWVLVLADDPSRTAELWGMAAVAWAFCLHAKPRFRSPRYPNRPPSPFRWPTFLLLAGAIFTTPVALLLPFFLVIQDLLFEGRETRPFPRRYWPGYLPYFVLIFAGFFVLSPRVLAPIPSTADYSLPVFWAGLLPRPLNGRFLDYGTGLLLAGGSVLFCADLVIGFSRQKVVLRYLLFAAVTAAVAIVPASLLGHNAAALTAINLVPLAAVFSVAAWRAAAALWAEQPEAVILPPAPPPVMDILIPRLGLEPVPSAGASSQQESHSANVVRRRLRSDFDLSRSKFGGESARARATETHQSLINTPGFSEVVFRSSLEPAIGPGARVLEWAAGSSPFASAIAARAGQFDRLAAGAGDQRITDLALKDLAGVRQLAASGADLDGPYDLACLVGVWTHLPSLSFHSILPIVLAAVRPGGRVVFLEPASFMEESAPEPSFWLKNQEWHDISKSTSEDWWVLTAERAHL